MMVVVVVISEVAVEAVAAEEADSIDLLSRDHQKKYEYIMFNMSHYFIFFLLIFLIQINNNTFITITVVV